MNRRDFIAGCVSLGLFGCSAAPKKKPRYVFPKIEKKKTVYFLTDFNRGDIIRVTPEVGNPFYVFVFATSDFYLEGAIFDKKPCFLFNSQIDVLRELYKNTKRLTKLHTINKGYMKVGQGVVYDLGNCGFYLKLKEIEYV
jgi:hypothetical protein